MSNQLDIPGKFTGVFLKKDKAPIFQRRRGTPLGQL
jgi:hypothetical protein